MASGSGGSYRDVLSIHDFRRLVIGSAASQLGDWLYNVALLVYVFERTHSATWVAVATMVRLLPFVILAPIGGVIADRFERVRVQVTAGLIQATIMAVIAVVVAQHGAAWLVIALAGLNTVAATPTRPAALAAMPSMVGETNLAPANALLHTVQDVGVVAGPAVGAAILAVGEPWHAFAANAATFVVSALVLSRIRTRSVGVVPEGEHAPSAMTLFVDGMRAVRDTPYVPILTLITFFGAFTYGAQTVQLVVYVQRQLDLGPDGYGYLLAAMGAGGVLGATVSAKAAARPQLTVPLMLGSVVFTGSSLAFAVTDVTVLAIAVALLSGLGMVVSDVISETAITRTASNEVMGRIFGATDGISVGAMVLGALIAAPVVSSTSVRTSLVILGAAAAGGTLLCAPFTWRLDRMSAGVVRALAPRLAVLSQLSIFAEAPQRVLEELAKAGEELRVGAGMIVIAEGDPADAFYVCLDGEVDVLTSAPGGDRPTMLATLFAPAYFGEIGLIESIPRTATVRAVTDCTLLRIDGDVFLAALTEAPAGRQAAADGVIRGLARTHPSVEPEPAGLAAS